MCVCVYVCGCVCVGSGVCTVHVWYVCSVFLYVFGRCGVCMCVVCVCMWCVYVWFVCGVCMCVGNGVFTLYSGDVVEPGGPGPTWENNPENLEVAAALLQICPRPCL